VVQVNQGMAAVHDDIQKHVQPGRAAAKLQVCRLQLQLRFMLQTVDATLLTGSVQLSGQQPYLCSQKPQSRHSRQGKSSCGPRHCPVQGAGCHRRALLFHP